MKQGDRVRVLTAFGTYLEKRAVSDVFRGDSFDVVRVCTEEEWEAAEREGRRPVGSAWPAEDVEELQPA